jgi:hypothetical protein
MPQTKFMFVYSFSRRRHLSAVLSGVAYLSAIASAKAEAKTEVLTKADGDVTSASFIDKNGSGLSFCLLKNPL